LKRLALLAGAACALLACGGAASAHAAASSGSGQAQAAGARNGAAGQITQLASSSLVLKTQTGSATVDYNGSTRFQQTSTGAVSDIVAGVCILAVGQPNAAGGVTAMTVTLSPKVNGACTLAAGNGNGRGTRTPPAGGNAAAAFFTRGEVAAVEGSMVTVSPSSGADQTITVSDNARVTMSEASSASRLAIGQCVIATGSRDSAGTVHATGLTIAAAQAGPSGCQLGFPGGFGPRGRPSPGASPPVQ
jgi:hypothetical protein